MKIQPFLSPCTKLKCKWSKDLQHLTRYTKILDEKLGQTLAHVGTGENFQNRTPMALALKSKIDKWDLMRLQSFCKSKDTVMKTKWQ